MLTTLQYTEPPSFDFFFFEVKDHLSVSYIAENTTLHIIARDQCVRVKTIIDIPGQIHMKFSRGWME